MKEIPQFLHLVRRKLSEAIPWKQTCDFQFEAEGRDKLTNGCDLRGSDLNVAVFNVFPLTVVV